MFLSLLIVITLVPKNAFAGTSKDVKTIIDITDKQKEMVTPIKNNSERWQLNPGNISKNLREKEMEHLKQEPEQSYIIKLKSTNDNIEKKLTDMQAKNIGKKENHIYKIKMDKDTILKNLAQGCEIEYIEADTKLKQCFTPNDPLYSSQQWNINSLNVDKVWDTTKGSSQIMIAVIDSGLEQTHPDFNNLTILNGYDYIFDDYDLWDSTGHGTFVSGIIAASGNNNIGIAGIAWNVKILPLHVMMSDGTAYNSDVAQAIYDAADVGANIINISMGSQTNDSTVQNAVSYALSKGVLLVAAAGNDGDNTLEYPAAYPGVISVGSTNRNDTRSSFSNYNSLIDFVAPGEQITSTIDPYFGNNNYYAIGSGTSFSAPHVTGIIALMKSVNINLTADNILNILKNSTIDLGQSGRDDLYGYGKIDALKALSLAANTKVNDASITSNNIPDVMVEGHNYSVAVGVTNTGIASWTKYNNYCLGAVGDSDPFAPARQGLNTEDYILTGQQKSFTFAMTAPSQGVYTTDWQMLKEGQEWFGQKLTKNVRVVSQSSYDKVKDFVTRFYTLILNRTPDNSGLDFWINSLFTRVQTGASAVNTFIDSSEFQSKNTNNQEYIQILYRLAFGREADEGGLNYWVNQLNDGVTRLYALHGFVTSAEFDAQCNDCGIIRGDVTMTRIFDCNPNLAKFVTRLYRLCLSRELDADGGEYWASSLYNHTITGADAVKGFVLSQEFEGKSLSDSEYVKILYRVAFGRESDPAGEAFWTSRLQSGYSRLSVLAGFINSNEFLEICNSYGIIRGSL
jgi:Subtilisin-like serine proteases